MKFNKTILIASALVLLSGCAVPPKPTQPTGKRIAINPEWIVKSQKLEEPAVLVDDSKKTKKRRGK